MKLLEREHNSFWEGTEEASAERQQPSPEAEIRISRHRTELARPLAEEHTVALKKILSLTSLIKLIKPQTQLMLCGLKCSSGYSLSGKECSYRKTPVFFHSDSIESRGGGDEREVREWVAWLGKQDKTDSHSISSFQCFLKTGLIDALRYES